MGIVGCEQFAVGGKSVFGSREEEYRSRGEREYARCRIAEYSSLRIAGVSLLGRRWDAEKNNNLMPCGARYFHSWSERYFRAYPTDTPAKRYFFFCLRIFTDLHESAPGLPGIVKRNSSITIRTLQRELVSEPVMDHPVIIKT